MSLLDEIKADRGPRQGAPSKFGEVVAALSEEDAADFTAALADPNIAPVKIFRRLEARNIDISASTVVAWARKARRRG